jgi:hypothetical protein
MEVLGTLVFAVNDDSNVVVLDELLGKLLRCAENHFVDVLARQYTEHALVESHDGEVALLVPVDRLGWGVGGKHTQRERERT